MKPFMYPFFQLALLRLAAHLEKIISAARDTLFDGIGD